MKSLQKISRLTFVGAVLALGVSGFHTAYANDPLPGDALAPPINVNIGTVYDLYENTGLYNPVRGPTVNYSTRLQDNAIVFRYIRTFKVASYTAGLEVYAPYVSFINQQQLGVKGLAPATVFGNGYGYAKLRAQSGFDQPEFIGFFYPVNTPRGTTLVVSPGFFPPISSFNKNASVNPGTENVWAGELDVGFRTVLFGEVDDYNLSLEAWDDLEVYGSNHDSGLVEPEIYADQILYPYNLFGVKNPIVPTSTTPAIFREQPTNQVRIYFPFEFNPDHSAYITPGIMQSFGGKQTYKLADGTIVDSGNRTQETQLRFIASALVSPTVELLGSFYFDVAAHGQYVNRVVQFRVLKFF